MKEFTLRLWTALTETQSCAHIAWFPCLDLLLLVSDLANVSFRTHFSARRGFYQITNAYNIDIQFIFGESKSDLLAVYATVTCKFDLQNLRLITGWVVPMVEPVTWLNWNSVPNIIILSLILLLSPNAFLQGFSSARTIIRKL